LLLGEYLFMVHDYTNNPLAGEIKLSCSIVLCTWALMCQTICAVNSLSPEEEEKRKGEEELPQ
jgi:formate hydrogenlyase subunit 6/NADH:ubiquinone oxidoreductase subunit I